MTGAVACNHCPNPIFDFGSQGVSKESEALKEKSNDTMRLELLRAKDNRYLRLQRAIPMLESLYHECRRADWDGRGAAPIPFRAIEEAQKLITQLPDDMPMPEIFPEVTGEVGFEWYMNPYKVLVLSTAGDGYIYYAGLFGFKNADNGSKPLAEQLHKKITSLLQEIIN